MTTKKLVTVAMLTAFDVVFTNLLAINTSVFKIGIGFAAVAVCAMLYGPGWAALCAALGDLAGALLFPTGAYFPGFTATAALTGLIFGLFLYKDRPGFVRCLLAAVLNCLVVTFVLNSLLIAYISGAKLLPLIKLRAVEFLVMAAVETAVISALSLTEPVYKIISENSAKKH